MKRFLDNKIVIAQFGGVSTPIFDPQSPEGQIGKGIDKMSDPEKAAIIDEAVKKYDNIISNERSSKSIFTNLLYPLLLFIRRIYLFSLLNSSIRSSKTKYLLICKKSVSKPPFWIK